MFLKKFYLTLVILLWYVAPAFAQVCDTVSLPDSFYVCKYTTIQLNATVTGTIPVDSISWIPTTGISNPHILNPTLYATVPGYYRIIVMSPGFASLITNGDFSAGNTGFTSSYTYVAPAPCALCTEGDYTISTTPQGLLSNNVPFGDHTTGSGNFLVANGAIKGSVNLWCQTVTVKPFTTYVFSGYGASTNADAASLPPPIIQVTIDGTTIGRDTFVLVPAVWNYFAFTWTSGASTTAFICLNDRNIFGVGNDFVIDDLAMREKDACATTDTVLISFIPGPTLNPERDTTILEGESTNFNAVGTYITSYKWEPPATLSCDMCPNPVATPAKTTAYVVSVTAPTGCVISDTINVFVYCDGTKVFIPNSFSPNGDGENDVFYPRGKGVGKINSFSIFNRQGQKVFERSNIDLNDAAAGWNGNYNGALLSSDINTGKRLRSEVFVYVIEAECASGAPIILKGDVTLIR